MTKKVTPKPTSRNKTKHPDPKTPVQASVSEQDEKLFADTNITMKSGHLTKDAEIVGDGNYVKMRFASNKQYQVVGEETIKTSTNYFDAMISHHLKEAFDLAKDFKKGDWIYIKGEDSTKSFDTPEGYKKTANTIFAYHVGLKKASQPKEAAQEHEASDLKTPQVA